MKLILANLNIKIMQDYSLYRTKLTSARVVCPVGCWRSSGTYLRWHSSPIDPMTAEEVLSQKQNQYIEWNSFPETQRVVLSFRRQSTGDSLLTPQQKRVRKNQRNPHNSGLVMLCQMLVCCAMYMSTPFWGRVQNIFKTDINNWYFL